jgi:hypothetical protein
MTSDLLTKNLPQEPFEKHTATFCGVDEYMTKTELGNLQVEEGVRGHMTPAWYMDVSRSWVGSKDAA